MKRSKLAMQTILVFAWACTAPAAVSASAANASSALSANSIKRYMFSMPSLASVQAEFVQRKWSPTRPWPAHVAGKPMRVTASAPSGFSTPFLIEQAGAQFHVYAERRRPQHPLAPLPYLTQEVVFDTPNPEVAPVGTLSFPAGRGPFPGVVLVAGSGPHTRDAGMSLHNTLGVIADHLTRRRFAVLRYDKRGVGLTGGLRHPDSTTDDYAADALAAVRFLKMQPQVDPGKVGIAGHSEGGIIAAMAAAEAPAEVRFIVMLGGTGLPGLEVATLQDAAARRADGMPESLVSLNQSFERPWLEIAASSRSRADAVAAMRAATLAAPAATRTALNIPAEGVPDEVYESLLTPWFRRFLVLDPRPSLEKVTCPVLALVGEKDVQVTPAENLREIERSLKRAAPQSQVRLLPGLNHNFQTARTGSPGEYFLIEETFAPSALALMSDWMKNAVGNSVQLADSRAGK